MYSSVRTLHSSPPRVDFATHAASLGCAVISVDTIPDLHAAYAKAREHAQSGTPAVVVIKTHPSSWTDAGAWWEIGVPEISHRPEITDAHTELTTAKTTQLRYLNPPP
jgi:3D-(3,5/4)-trihydroxycyclohexane-1,2-dione acylhydrolase (decyclizing)